MLGIVGGSGLYSLGDEFRLDEQLPRNASGKFLKKELQKQLLVADAH